MKLNVLEDLCHGHINLDNIRFPTEHALVGGGEETQAHLCDQYYNFAQESVQPAGTSMSWQTFSNEPQRDFGGFGAPESDRSRASDVYSFGVVIFSLASLTLPEPGTAVLIDPKGMLEDGEGAGGVRIDRSRCCADLVQLASECCRLDPSQRPTADAICKRLATPKPAGALVRGLSRAFSQAVLAGRSSKPGVLR